MFFEGLAEQEDPYKFFAQQGIHDMLTHGGAKIFPCIPQLIIPIKSAYNLIFQLLRHTTHILICNK